MELRVFWSALLRRWYLVVLVIVGTVFATYYLYARVGPTYEAKGATLIFPPLATVQRASGTEAQGNPYLDLNGVGQARDIVIRSLTAKTTQEALAARYPTAEIEATPDFTNSAPIILVTVESPDPAESIAAMKAALDLVPPTLAGLQDGLGLRDSEKITSRQLLADSEPDVLHTKQIRTAVLGGGGLLGAGLLLIGLVDGFLAYRRRPRGRRSKPKSTRPAATTDSPTTTSTRTSKRRKESAASVADSSGPNKPGDDVETEQSVEGSDTTDMVTAEI